MNRALRLFLALTIASSAGGIVPSAGAVPPANSGFLQTWERTDKPVAEIKVSRTWMWGQEATFDPMWEPYAEAPGGRRLVQYFDKSRMEDSAYVNSTPPWDVTNGLLAWELITGKLQLGNSSFEQYFPAPINVAGDPDDETGVTYATFKKLMSYAPIPSGWLVTQTVDHKGVVLDGGGLGEILAGYGVTAQDVGAPTNHTVASVFWEFMRSQGTVYQGNQYTTAQLFDNPFYATGYPLTEAYWTIVRVGGVSKRVLVQVFERRVLTYTPDNPAGWQVEAGNVGLHYTAWRYGMLGGLRAVGNRIVDAQGQPVMLYGVNRAGSEFACVQGLGVFSGPVDDASIRAIASWGANAVRIPLNEQCWLGGASVPAAYAGVAYQRAIADYVQRITAHGMYAILELHWTGIGATIEVNERPLANRAHSPALWRSVAATFKANPAVLFELFNEPHPDFNQDTEDAWRLWRDGGSGPGVPYDAAGMQELVDAVRATGATNVILLGGVQWANSLSRWVAYRPDDPLTNLAASWHSYQFNPNATIESWDRTIAPTAREYPVVAAEIGGETAHLQRVMDWLDRQGIGYLAWGWNVWGSPTDLITDYAGTPTTHGQVFRNRLTSLAPQRAEPG